MISIVIFNSICHQGALSRLCDWTQVSVRHRLFRSAIVLIVKMISMIRCIEFATSQLTVTVITYPRIVKYILNLCCAVNF